MQVPFKEGDAALHRDQWRGGGEVDGDDGDYRESCPGDGGGRTCIKAIKRSQFSCTGA